MKTKINFLIALFFMQLLFIRAQDTIYVPLDYPTIQQGIDASSDENVVLVDTGTYVENINFMGKAITVASKFIYSGDSNHINYTIIDGREPDNPDYGSVVTFITQEDTSSVLCGFTLTGGTGFSLPESNDRIGGGIVCYYAGAKIKNNKIIYNEVIGQNDAAGGGIGCIEDLIERWIVIEHNDIMDNSCYSINSKAFGGGIYISCNAKISHNTIKDNQLQSDQSDAKGAGIFVIGDTEDSVLILNNIISNNIVSARNLTLGGGICFYYSHAVISKNVINANSLTGETLGWGGGVMIRYSSSLEFIDNQIRDNEINLNTNNTWNGPGCCIRDMEGKTSILKNEFKNNSGLPDGFGRGGGLDLRDALENEVIVDANYFLNNSCFRGGGMYERGCYNILITNNIFSNNSATHSDQGRGGGLVINNPAKSSGLPISILREGRSLLINNTFFSNVADYQGGAFHYNGGLSPPVIFNTIFWDNEAPVGRDINNVTGETIIVSFSDLDTLAINGLWIGEDNINEDPLFIDPENGNFSIDCKISPCAGTGVDSIYVYSSWYHAPDYDIRDSLRPMPDYSMPDMGAFEVDLCDDINEFNLQPSTFNLQCYPNPTRGISHFSFRISQYQYVTIKIYDIHGREVAFVLDKKLPAGEHVVRYDDSGLPDGIYLIRVQAGEEAVTGKVVVMRAY